MQIVHCVCNYTVIEGIHFFDFVGLFGNKSDVEGHSFMSLDSSFNLLNLVVGICITRCNAENPAFCSHTKAYPKVPELAIVTQKNK